MSKLKKVIIIVSFILIIPTSGLAHSGRTDSNGGHWDYSAGTYHYHSGIYANTGEYTAPIEEGGTSLNDSSSNLQLESSIYEDLTSAEIQIRKLESTLEEKENIINNLFDSVNEKDKEIEALKSENNNQIIELCIGFIFISFIITYISYNIGLNKK